MAEQLSTSQETPQKKSLKEEIDEAKKELVDILSNGNVTKKSTKRVNLSDDFDQTDDVAEMQQFIEFSETSLFQEILDIPNEPYRGDTQ